MKLVIEDFIEEVKQNFLAYEEEGELAAASWEKEFKIWMDKPSNKKKKCFKEEKGKLYFVIKDEEEVMEAADSYLDALDEKKVKKYWQEF